MNYIVLIFDLKDSRHLRNRYEIQMKLIDAIKECNLHFHESIVSDFLITIGDEWEGLLKPNADYQSIISFFQEQLSDVSFYTGIGIGEITITNFELTVNQLDGPAFYMARDAIRLAKSERYSTVLVQY